MDRLSGVLCALLVVGASGCTRDLLDLTGAPPACLSPAPLLGKKSAAPGYIVVYRDGTDAAAVTGRLSRKYEFTPRTVYEHAFPGFSAELSGAALAGIRCEKEVRYAEYNSVVRIG